MGEHLNTKKDPSKHHKRGFSEGVDVVTQRKSKASFKNYLQDLEDDLMNEELAANEEWIIEKLVEGEWVRADDFSSPSVDHAEYHMVMMAGIDDIDQYRVTLG
jgi:hypothetical protein